MIRALVLAGIGLFGLGACGDPFPEDFTISVDGPVALGFAEVDEFSEAEIQSALRSLCPGGPITRYTSELGADGNRFFGARCESGYVSATGSIYVTRTASGMSFDMP